MANKLNSEFYILAAKLMRIWQAVHNKNAIDFRSYIQSNYNIEIKTNQELSYITGYPENNSSRIKNDYYDEFLEKFLFKERLNLQGAYYSAGDFGIKYDYNYESGEQFCDYLAKRGKYLISWNTYIDPYEWSSPNIQTHLSYLNKSSLNILLNSNPKKNEIQYRILIFNLGEVELKTKLNDEDFKNQFNFFYKLNSNYNVNLGIITIDILSDIFIKESFFFKDSNTLNFLGFNEKEINKLLKIDFESSKSELRIILKKVLTIEKDVPKELNPFGMDFLQCVEGEIKMFDNLNNSVWVAYKQEGLGLSYAEIQTRSENLSNISKFGLTDFEKAFLVKIEFSKIVLNYIFDFEKMNFRNVFSADQYLN